jgi:hypothetical protein
MTVIDKVLDFSEPLNSFSHYTAALFHFNPNRRYLHERVDKPDGLWLSVDGPDDWYMWCHKEDFRVESLAFRTKFVVDLDRCLVAVTKSDLIEFTDRYGNPDHYGIDWAKVALDYSGFVMPNYKRHHDRKLWWQNFWDCSSAAIWDLSVVRPLRWGEV